MKLARTLTALSGAALLSLATAGVATAQSDVGTLSTDVVGSVGDSVGSHGGDPDNPGVIDTSGSALIGEPTLGSLPGSLQDAWTGSVAELDGFDDWTPEAGQGSVQLPGCVEPTSANVDQCIGHLAPQLLDTGSLAGSLEIATGSEDRGESLAIGSLATGALGSAAAIGVGAAIAQGVTLEDLGIEIPELPAL